MEASNDFFLATSVVFTVGFIRLQDVTLSVSLYSFENCFKSVQRRAEVHEFVRLRVSG